MSSPDRTPMATAGSAVAARRLTAGPGFTSSVTRLAYGDTGARPRAPPVEWHVVATDFPAELAALRSTFEQIAAVSNPDAIKARVADLEKRASVPNLWDDQENAQAVTGALSAANSELERLE